jgi:CMP-N-acetylneuraminic acid synthetase
MGKEEIYEDEEMVKHRGREVLGLIPTRGGSKGLENKNIRILEGKPLITYTIDAARRCEDITRLIVSTDNHEIETVAREYGAEVFRHPPELSADGMATFPVIEYVVRNLIMAGHSFDFVATMRATTPLRLPEDISNAIRLATQTGADSVVSLVADATGHPIRLKMLDNELRVSSLERGEEDAPVIRQNLPLVYRRNGAVYVTKTNVILDGSLFGNDLRGYVMPKERSVNINDEVDFVLAAALLKAVSR